MTHEESKEGDADIEDDPVAAQAVPDYNKLFDFDSSSKQKEQQPVMSDSQKMHSDLMDIFSGGPSSAE